MRYMMLVVMALLLWFLLREFVFTDRSEEGLETFGDKVRDLGSRLHLVFGILAVLLLLIMAGRFIVTYFSAP